MIHTTNGKIHLFLTVMLAVTLLISSFGPLVVAAQHTSPVTGRITVNGEPQDGVTVTGFGKTTTTDDGGMYKIKTGPHIDGRITASYKGYSASSAPLETPANPPYLVVNLNIVIPSPTAESKKSGSPSKAPDNNAPTKKPPTPTPVTSSSPSKAPDNNAPTKKPPTATPSTSSSPSNVPTEKPPTPTPVTSSSPSKAPDNNVPTGSVHYPFWDMTDSYHNMSVSGMKNNTSARLSAGFDNDSTQNVLPMPSGNNWKRWGSNMSTEPKAPQPVDVPTGVIMGLCFACIPLAGAVEILITRKR